MFQKPRAESYGRGVVELEPDDGPSPEALTTMLEQRLAAPGFQLPAPPRSAFEVMELSRRPDVELGDVVRLLERDSVFAGRVLKVARSSLYAGVAPVKTLKEAAVRLGLNTLRQVVMEAAVTQKVFKVAEYTEAAEKLRVHSVAVGHLSRMVARLTSVDAEYAFLCGLLHDVGIVATLLALADVPRGQQRPKLTPEVWSAIDSLHESATGLVTASWKVAEDIQLVVRRHHSLREDGYPHPVRAILLVAETLADEAGMGVTPTLSGMAAGGLTMSLSRPDAPPLREALATLRLEERQLGGVRKELPKLESLTHEAA